MPIRLKLLTDGKNFFFFHPLPSSGLCKSWALKCLYAASNGKNRFRVSLKFERHRSRKKHEINREVIVEAMAKIGLRVERQ